MGKLDPANWLEFDHEGKAVCDLCERAFDNLGLHTWHVHDMTAEVYRKQRGIPHSVGLVSIRVRNLERAAIAERKKANPEAWRLTQSFREAAEQRRLTELAKGPHDERNYRRGCRCDTCKADHAHAYRAYRRSGRFPDIRPKDVGLFLGRVG